MTATRGLVLALAGIALAHPAGAAEDVRSRLDAIVERLGHAALDPGRAVDAAGFVLPLDYGELRLERGVLVPVTLAGDERTFELAFRGTGRLRLEAPDEVEAQQLAYFTGRDAIDAPVREAILVVADGSLAGRLSPRPAVAVEPETLGRLQRLFGEWVDDTEREGFGARSALIRAMVGDPVGQGFLGLWLESGELGRIFYCVDPSRQEPVTLGAFELFDNDDFRTWRARKQARKKRASSAPRPDRPRDDAKRGCSDDEDAADDDDEPDDSFGWIKVWLSARRPGADPEADPHGLEPEHYDIEMTLAGADLKAEATTRIRLRPDADGLRVVRLGLVGALDVCEVHDADQRPLAFERRGRTLLVELAEATVAGRPVELTIRTAGEPIRQLFARRTQRNTTYWHPHTGTIDRATYDVTLRWPAELSLLASGRPVEGGTDDGRRWTRNVLDVPTVGFSFEVGDLEVLEDHVGHIDLSFGFDRRDREMTDDVRTEIVQTVKAALLFFESRLGHLPIDRMSVTLADRDFSQSLLGFVTLSEGAAHHGAALVTDNRTAQEARLETIAHEISHQWWGHLVGWDSYRDQWLSEALADFSAAEFMSTIATRPEVYRRKHAELWRAGLRSETFDGRRLGSVGPVVLGRRLRWNHGLEAYVRVVYDKGAAVFSTLAQRLEPEPFWQMLGSLSRAVNNRVIRTATFFRALERMSGQDLSGFVRQYVRGTGLPALFYDYRSRPAEQGGWVVEGTVRQFPGEQFRYVLRRTGRGWDVARRVTGPVDAAQWSGVVPFYVETSSGGGAPHSALRGNLTVRGENSTFSIPVDERPIDFQLDPLGQHLAEVHREGFEPRRHLCSIGEHLARLGRLEDAAATLDLALRREIAAGDTPPPDEPRLHELEARLRLARARVALDRGDTAAAKDELRAANAALPKDSDYYAGERMVLGLRLDMVSGRYELALGRIKDYLRHYGIEFGMEDDRLLDDSKMTAGRVSRGEVRALYATAAYELGDRDAALFVRRAALDGVDMRALGLPPG